MAEIPGSFSISKMIRKETHDIFVIQGIKRLDRVCESIYHLFHLLQFSVLIDVLPWLISTSNRWSMLFNGFQGDRWHLSVLPTLLRSYCSALSQDERRRVPSALHHHPRPTYH